MLVDSGTPDEQRDAEAEAALQTSKVTSRFEEAGQKHAVRAFHVKAHGILRAKVTVRDDLPREWEHGVFQRGRTYDAWARVSSAAFGDNPDTKADVHGFALKLVGVEGERAAGGFETQTQDFLLIDSPYLMVGTIAQALGFDRATIAGSLSLGLHLLTHPGQLGRVLAMRKKPSHPLGGTYSSVAPFRLGPTTIVRWALRVASGVELVHVPPGPDFLRKALRRQLEATGGVPLELCVEVRDSARQPLDDGSVDWRGSLQRVADVLLLREGFDTEAQEAAGEAMSFNPWNALEAHRPLGNLNRARRIVYRAVYAKRTALNGKEPFEPR